MRRPTPGELAYATNLTGTQAALIYANIRQPLSRLRKYRPEDILNAIAYVVKTGCQWAMLPAGFPPWKTVYHHFRSLGKKDWFQSFLDCLVAGKRASLGQDLNDDVCVIDSQSVRSGLSDSEKGIDGNKRIKGIKRHVAVDSNGYVMSAHVTKANVHDSRGAIPLVCDIIDNKTDIEVVKGDMGYRGLELSVRDIDGVTLDCVKSNFGSVGFVPISGRWVVERTFSWMDNYRRLTRNYERLLKVAKIMFTAACVFFMIRYCG